MLLTVVCGIGAYIPHRYHFVNENKTWSEAQNYCREKYTDLASINDMGEMMKLNYTLKRKLLRKLGSVYRERTLGNGSGLWQTKLSTETETLTETGVMDNQTTTGEMKKNTNTNRYMFINETKTWCDAQTYCREKHNDLVSVRNQTENEQIRKLIQNSPDNIFWIGLFNDSWKWSDQSNSSFRYWSSDKPSGDLNCAAVKVSEQHSWTNVNCRENLPFICHEKRLVLINQSLTWKEALNYCRNHHYDLVSVRSEEMQLWVKEVVQNASTEHVWLGLRHDCVQRIWFWVFGSMICYHDWSPGNGTMNEDCSHERRSGAVQSGGKQQCIELSEGYKLNFICSTYDDMF
ncbi:macrophage mannose receptor 1-like [Ictalurus furcatus]|uniref:macrophage mannose receptor 1-like n=1 Tax=Ictalurus furcatus TaxID=66913 RepID=UPI0023501425|nr:macrophage mannose receptor 1-like [Ictalurus furcatus]